MHLVPSEPVKYGPVAAKGLMDRMRKAFERSFELLDRKLNCLEQERQMDVIINLVHIVTGKRSMEEMGGEKGE